VRNDYPSDLKKRVFLLTDGSVSSPDAVVYEAKASSDTMRIFSFGLGDGCDERLVNLTARAGRGTSTIV